MAKTFDSGFSDWDPSRLPDLTGKRYFITGANAGLGFEAAQMLRVRNADVFVGARNEGRGRGAVTNIAATPGTGAVEFVKIDLASKASIDEAASTVRTLAADGLDAIVNNAGFQVESSVAQLTDELMHAQLDTNLVGPLRLIRSVLPAWIERGSGVIVNISSKSGRVGSPFAGAYSASKFALEGLSESLHFEVTDRGIRVHLIEPGSFPTDFRSGVRQPATWAGSNDEARCLAFRAARRGFNDSVGEADAQVVAEAIVDAITNPETPFRVLCGDDAKMIDGVKSSMSFEEFETTIRATINWQE